MTQKARCTLRWLSRAKLHELTASAGKPTAVLSREPSVLDLPDSDPLLELTATTAASCISALNEHRLSRP